MIIDTIVAIFYWVCAFGFTVVLKVAVISQLCVLHSLGATVMHRDKRNEKIIHKAMELVLIN